MLDHDLDDFLSGAELLDQMHLESLVLNWSLLQVPVDVRYELL